jgi:K+-sensing histidine kinase KdpD
VLDLTQSEAGLLPIATEEIDLLTFVTNVVREREEPIEARKLTVDLRGDKGAGSVQADKRQLGRALGNLLDNAIAAVPEGGRVLVALSRQKKGARIVISDNGPGMKPSELSRRWRPVARLAERHLPNPAAGRRGHRRASPTAAGAASIKAERPRTASRPRQPKPHGRATNQNPL